MTGIVCLQESDVDTYSAAVDVKLGYPRDGIDIGTGVHAPRSQSRTLRNADRLKHPTLAQWAYLDDSDTKGPTPIATPPGATVKDLDSSWFPRLAAAVDAPAEEAKK